MHILRYASSLIYTFPYGAGFHISTQILTLSDLGVKSIAHIPLRRYFSPEAVNLFVMPRVTSILRHKLRVRQKLSLRFIECLVLPAILQHARVARASPNDFVRLTWPAGQAFPTIVLYRPTNHPTDRPK